MKALKVIPALFLALCAALPLTGQESDSPLQKVLDYLTTVDMDQEAVYSPRPRLNVTMMNDLRRTGVNQTYSFDQKGSSGETIPVTASFGLHERLYTGLGLYVGYGGLLLGASREIGNKSAERSRSFTFDQIGSSNGIQFRYYDIQQPMTYTLQMGKNKESGTTEKPGRMKTFTLSAFHALNQKSFAYPAVYRGNLLQRRSAGSWMVSAKYLQGSVQTDPAEDISRLVYGLTRQATYQFSLGAGYSYNYVFLHRQPARREEKGLRNLTANCTLLPMLPLMDRHRITRQVSDPVTGLNASKETRPVNSTFRINCLTQAGLAYTYDRLFLALTAEYDGFSFRGTTKVTDSGASTDIKTAGHFRRWSATIHCRVEF